MIAIVLFFISVLAVLVLTCFFFVAESILHRGRSRGDSPFFINCFKTLNKRNKNALEKCNVACSLRYRLYLGICPTFHISS